MSADRLDTGSKPLPDGTEKSLSFAVIESVSDVTGKPPEQLPSLTRFVDPDALDALFTTPESSGRLTFEYAGHSVTVFSDRTVTVTERTTERS